MTGRGRPAIGERVEVRIPPDLLARLDAEAARQGITRAELVRDIVKEKVSCAQCQHDNHTPIDGSQSGCELVARVTHRGGSTMTITTTRSNRDELEARLASLLGELGMTIDALDARRAAGSLTADEWAVWEQVDAIRYLG